MGLQRLPSLGTAVSAAASVLRRFPLVLAAGIAAATAAILTQDGVGPAWLQDQLLAAATLGLPLLTATTLFGERFRSSGPRVGLALAAAAVLVAVYLAWPHWSDPVRFARYVQLSVAFHLLVAFLPFAGRDLPDAFWRYNRVLFIRFVAAAVSSGTLYLGLALALVALDKLFGVDVPPEGYFRLWAVMAFVFNTWFFLGGVPADVEVTESQQEYPPALRIFAQYTLVPLVSVYLGILTLYLGKVVVTWDWPSGWIGNLVSGVAALGIFTLLLVHPLAGRADQRWIAVFARAFWLGIVPAVVMLWLALYQRIHQYGLTEPRYFLLVLSLWLAAVAAFQVITRSRSIRLVPVSLCLAALATFAGPWGAFSLSERSQLGRLRALLDRYGVLADGRIHAPTRAIPPADLQEISATVRYVVETHGPAHLVPLLGEASAGRAGLVAGRGGFAGEDRVRKVVEVLGVRYVAPGGNGRNGPFYYTGISRGTIPVAGYDVLLRVREDSGAASDTGLVAVLARETRRVRIGRAGDVLLEVPLDSALAVARTGGDTRGSHRRPGPALRAEAENARARAVVYLDRLQGIDRPAGAELTGAGGFVLVMLKR